MTSKLTQAKKGLGDQQIVIYKSGKHHFEVAVQPAEYALYREGKIKFPSDVLATEGIFTSFTKGQIAAQDELRSVFDVKSKDQIIDVILREGTVHASTSEKRGQAEQHKKDVIEYVHSHYLNKQTRLPVPLKELADAIEKAKIHIGDKDVAHEAADVAHKLLGTITLKEGDITGTVEMKASYVPQAMGVIHRFTKIKNEAQAWFGDEMKYRVAIKPGDYDEFRGQLDKITKGDYRFELGQIESHAPVDDDGRGQGHDSGADRENKKVHQKEIEKQHVIQEKQKERARVQKERRMSGTEDDDTAVDTGAN